MNKFKIILASLSLLLLAGISGIVTPSVYASSHTTGNTTTEESAFKTISVLGVSAGKADACEALKEIDATHGCGSKDTTINRIIRSVVNVLAYIVGFVSVIMVIIAGFKYVTSGGDSNRVASAKTTIVYAIVGLIIAALAQIIVSTVLTGTINSTTDCPTNKTISVSNPACKP